jgi:hypothetical protein
VFAPSFVNYKKGALDSQPHVIKLTSCLSGVGGSLRVLRLPPPLNTKSGRHDIAEILLKMALRHHKLESQSSHLVENEQPNPPVVYAFEYLVLCVVFCQSLSVFLSVLSSNYPFGIFKLVIQYCIWLKLFQFCFHVNMQTSRLIDTKAMWIQFRIQILTIDHLLVRFDVMTHICEVHW